MLRKPGLASHTKEGALKHQDLFFFFFLAKVYNQRENISSF